MKQFALLLLFASSLWACKENHQQLAIVREDPDIIPVQVTPLTISEEVPPIRVSGTVQSSAQKKLSFKIGGIIQEIAVNEGQRFQKGQVLARLRQEEINAQVAKAKQNVAKLERDLQRVERLFKDTVATLENVQDLKTALEVAKSDLEIAKFNQQYSVIVAGENGKVLQRFAEPGELTSPGNPLLLVGTTGKGATLFHASLSDRDVVKLVLGDSASLNFDAYPGQQFQGFATEIAEQANPQSGTFEVEITLSNHEFPLKNGFIGEASIYPSGLQKAIKLPMSAVVEAKEQEAVVFTIENEQAHRKTWATKHVGDDFILVNPWQEVSEGTLVVTASRTPLKDGQKVVY